MTARRGDFVRCRACRAVFVLLEKPPSRCRRCGGGDLAPWAAR